MNVLNFSSVKTTYLLLSTILALVIIATIIVSESKIKSTAVKLSTDIKQRIEVSEILEDLHVEISKANSTLDLYLISPNTQSRKKFDLAFINIYKNINQLNTNQWLKTNLIRKTITNFDNNVHELNVDATELMDIRINPNEMYPFLKLLINQCYQKTIEFQPYLIMPL